MRYFLSCLLSVLILVGCEDFLKKEIKVDTVDPSPKVVVTSALEDSLFYIYISLSSPLNKSPFESEKVDKALVQLYEDDELILQLTTRDNYPNLGIPNYYPESRNKMPFAVRKNIRVAPGKNYELKVSVEGYPPVSSTVVAPSKVTANRISAPNYSNIIEKSIEQMAYVNSFFSGHCSYFFPVSFNLIDNQQTKDYYMLEAFEIVNNQLSISDIYMSSQRLLLATTDRALIQDNPDVVADQWLNETEINTFSFEQLIVSDLSFQGQTKTFNLLMSSCLLNTNKDNCYRLSLYYPESRIMKTHYSLCVLVRHLNAESYHYYRTFALQRVGLDYFSEPASLISNIEGGYGCFAVCSTTKVLIDEYDVCVLRY